MVGNIDVAGEMNDLAIRRAEDGEEQAVADILTEAAEWLIATGRTMWQPGEVSVEQVRERAASGEWILAFLDGEPAATMLIQWEDDFFWLDVARGESLFLHRVAVRRAVAGRGVPGALIAWAKGAARKAGRKYLRVECSARRPRLRNVYESAGFSHHSVREMGSHLIARYEIQVGGNDFPQEDPAPQ